MRIIHGLSVTSTQRQQTLHNSKALSDAVLHLELLLGLQYGRHRSQLEGELWGGRHHAHQALQRLLALVPEEERDLALGALEAQLHAHLPSMMP